MPDELQPTDGRAFVSTPTPAPDPYHPEPGLRIRHHVPQDHSTSVKRPCIWCGQPTDILAETPFAPDLGALPLMLTCGAHMRIVYRMVQKGEALDSWEQAAVARIVAMTAPQLTTGRQTRLLILSSHAILEYDDLRLFTDLGYDTFVIGAYTDPHNPAVEFGKEPFRPPVPEARQHPDLAALCHEQRVKHANLGQEVDFSIVDWAKADLHPELVEWADIIMVNCFPEMWIAGQWGAIKHKRVIWRTIGQSSPFLETEMRPLVADGLEVVRYSPAERRAFEPIGAWAGEHAMIRFCKYPDDFGPWRGDWETVGNVTQNMIDRGDHCGLEFWQKATLGLPTMPAGLGSERMPMGLGTLSYGAMLDYLSHLRAYLYTGTQPASYTLGLMEAMLAGVPVVSIGPADMWMPALFEGHEFVDAHDDPAKARLALQVFLADPLLAAFESEVIRTKAVSLFSPEVIGPQWLDFLGSPVPEAEAVAA